MAAGPADYLMIAAAHDEGYDGLFGLGSLLCRPPSASSDTDQLFHSAGRQRQDRSGFSPENKDEQEDRDHRRQSGGRLYRAHIARPVEELSLIGVPAHVEVMQKTACHR